jgi:hypothetical protein
LLKQTLFILTFIAFCLTAKTQVISQYTIVNGDTIAASGADPVVVVTKRDFKNKKANKDYEMLVWRVKKTYPIAKIAGEKFTKINEEIKNLPSDERKERLKKVEDELTAEYEPIIRKMSLNTGKILLRLIDRETGQNSYAIVKDLRGAFRATFYQGIAKLFGANLKATYNPETNDEDRMIEDIIQKIDRGEL